MQAIRILTSGKKKGILTRTDLLNKILVWIIYSIKTKKYAKNSNFDMITIFSILDRDISFIISNNTAKIDNRFMKLPIIIPIKNLFNKIYN
jgi:hypothetical protein